ncbi:MAG TPA: hypothetical protein VEZ47_12850 [Gemmatirosa sp.]|nr:hypothetical protein [Gemmatirosa sp.]
MPIAIALRRTSVPLARTVLALASLTPTAIPAQAAPAGARPPMVAIPALYTPTAPGASLACTPPPAPDDLAGASDEFDARQTPGAPGGRWQWFHERYGWPSMVRRADVGETHAGELTLEPLWSGWFADYHAPFLFQTIRGDFDVTARVRAASVDGAADALPRATWSLVGLMARAPRAVTPADWQPRGENWLFVTTGTAEAPGVPVFESKSTVNSGSNLKLRPARAGWLELRIVRMREVFLLLTREPGEAWRLRERVLRRDMPYADVQVGLVAYSDGTSGPPALRQPQVHNTLAPDARARVGAPDLRARVDWVHVRRPPALRDVAPDWLVDHEVSERAIVRFLECGRDGA